MDDAAQVIRDTIDNISSRPRQLTIEQPQNGTENFTTGEGSADKPRTIGDGHAVDDNLEVLHILEDEHKEERASDNGSEIRPVTVHVTKKDIERQLEKFDSLSALKKMLKKYPDTTFNMRQEKAEEIVFLERVISGEVHAHDIWNRYFQISSEEELRDQLGSATK